MGLLLLASSDPAAARAWRRTDPGAMVVSLGPSLPDVPTADVRVAVSDPLLRSRLEAALASALAPVSQSPASPPIVHLRTLRRARTLGPTLHGALAIVTATDRNVRRLAAIVACLEPSGVAAIQLVCPPPLSAPLEAVVFALLEERRGQPGRIPLLLSPTPAPLESLLATLTPRGR